MRLRVGLLGRPLDIVFLQHAGVHASCEPVRAVPARGGFRSD